MTEQGDDEAKNTIIAQDDFGRPITASDIYSGSYQRPINDDVFSSVPPFDFEGDDDDRETHCLVERVKRRRKADREKGELQ
jgi:hypothetical protein